MILEVVMRAVYNVCESGGGGVALHGGCHGWLLSSVFMVTPTTCLVVMGCSSGPGLDAIGMAPLPTLLSLSKSLIGFPACTSLMLAHRVTFYRCIENRLAS